MSSRILLLASFVGIVALLAAASRTSAPPQDQDAKKAESSKDSQDAKDKEKEAKEKAERDKALKRAALERDLPIAKEKVENARRDLADQTADAQAASAKLQKELQLAKTKLETFEKREAPARTAKAQLDLQYARDNHENNKEELEQLELMYKDQDLADKTREIVIRRAKRELERTQQRLALQQEELGILTERTLPQEREKLSLDVEEKQREIARAERGTQKAMGDKKVALMAAESEIKRIEGEMMAQKESK
jgi:hypothetical protein